MQDLIGLNITSVTNVKYILSIIGWNNGYMITSFPSFVLSPPHQSKKTRKLSLLEQRTSSLNFYFGADMTLVDEGLPTITSELSLNMPAD